MSFRQVKGSLSRPEEVSIVFRGPKKNTLVRGTMHVELVFSLTLTVGVPYILVSLNEARHAPAFRKRGSTTTVYLQ